MRIPRVFRAPGERRRVITIADPVSGIDLFPTLLSLLRLPEVTALHGRSLVPYWEGRQSDPDRPIYAGQGYEGRDRMVMLRTPRFKLTRYDDGGNELHDLQSDPGELTNVYEDSRYKTSLNELSRQLDQWDRSYPHRERA
jgi:arylsulfatase A-like enzyme